MSRSGSERREAYIAVQTLIGLAAFAIWVIVGVWVLEEDLGATAMKLLPYLVFYEIGVLSRYFPGVRASARTMDGWSKGRA